MRIQQSEVLDLLTSLVEKSLVVYDEDEHGRGRYRFLETVRQYGLERLEAKPEAADQMLGERHAAYFLGFAEERDKRANTVDEVIAWNEMEAELDNLRAGMDWAIGSRRDELCARYALALLNFLWRRGYWVERLERGMKGLSAAQHSFAREHRDIPRLMHGVALAYQDQGNYEEAKSYYQELIPLYQELGDRQGMARSLNTLANISYDQGDYSEAERLCEQSLTLYRQLQDQFGIALMLGNLGLLVCEQGDFERARHLYEES